MLELKFKRLYWKIDTILGFINQLLTEIPKPTFLELRGCFLAWLLIINFFNKQKCYVSQKNLLINSFLR